jgi:hypothetical protein
MVEGGGFEPPKLTRQIYSLIPLATREPLRKATYFPYEPCLCQQFLPIKLETYKGLMMETKINQPQMFHRSKTTQISITNENPEIRANS